MHGKRGFNTFCKADNAASRIKPNHSIFDGTCSKFFSRMHRCFTAVSSQIRSVKRYEFPLCIGQSGQHCWELTYQSRFRRTINILLIKDFPARQSFNKA